MNEKIEISVVVPVYNEEENLLILIPQLFGVLERLGKPFEVSLVQNSF